MIKKIKTHPDYIGPAIHIDLKEVILIEERGQRKSKAGFVEAGITLGTGLNIKIKMNPKDLDQLINDWTSASSTGN